MKTRIFRGGRGTVALFGWICAVGVLFPVSSANAHGVSTGGLETGKKIYRMNCAICHGTGGRGDGVGSRRLKSPTPDFTRPGFWKGKSDAYLFHLISNGIGDMPAWSDRLTPGQITDVLHYIRSLPDPAPENRQPPSR